MIRATGSSKIMVVIALPSLLAVAVLPAGPTESITIAVPVFGVDEGG